MAAAFAEERGKARLVNCAGTGSQFHYLANWSQSLVQQRRYRRRHGHMQGVTLLRRRKGSLRTRSLRRSRSGQCRLPASQTQTKTRPLACCSSAHSQHQYPRARASGSPARPTQPPCTRAAAPRRHGTARRTLRRSAEPTHRSYHCVQMMQSIAAKGRPMAYCSGRIEKTARRRAAAAAMQGSMTAC